MSVILGIDLGTQSVKAMMLNVDTGKMCTATKEYEVDVPQLDFAEQRPSAWWDSVRDVCAQLKSENPKAFEAVTCIGITGQMHGLVALDCNLEPVMPAIIWVDQRSKRQVNEIYKHVPLDEMATAIHNRVFTGFAFPSLLWIKRERPDAFARIYRICCPKDYIRLRLTGRLAGEVTDASSTTAFHVGRRDWYYEMLERFGLERRLFPECGESTDVAGQVSITAETETGIKAGTQVVYGAGDLPALIIGSGAWKPGMLVCNIGTGGVVATQASEDAYDPLMRIHSFCHAVERSNVVFGAILAGGLSLNWLKNKLLYTDSYEQISALAGKAAVGSDGLIYLPYLGGERTPHMDPNATGMFFGLRLMHDRQHICRAVMEGVTFALKESVGILDEIGIPAGRVIASGGGAKSPVWLQMQADIFGCEVQATGVVEQACLGACIIAGVGTGLFGSVREACTQLVTYEDKVYRPDTDRAGRYAEVFTMYRNLYTANRELMRINTDKTLEKI